MDLNIERIDNYGQEALVRFKDGQGLAFRFHRDCAWEPKPCRKHRFVGNYANGTLLTCKRCGTTI